MYAGRGIVWIHFKIPVCISYFRSHAQLSGFNSRDRYTMFVYWWSIYCLFDFLLFWLILNIIIVSFIFSFYFYVYTIYYRFGGKVAAQFCALYTLYNQYNYDTQVDIYSLAYLYHKKRPAIWEAQVRNRYPHLKPRNVLM